MKTCERCKVTVFEGQTNCPLCGSYLETHAEANDYAENVEPFVAYPSLTVKDEPYRGLLSLKALLLLAVATVVCIVLNIILDHTHLWSAYVGIGCLIAYTCAISTVYRRRRFYTQIAVYAYFLSAAAFACDLVVSFDITGSVALFRYSLEYIVPALLAAALITCDVMLFVDRHSGKYYFVTLWFVTLIAIVPQIVVWATAERFGWYLTFPLFFFAVVNALGLSVVCWTRFRSELKRKFFV